MAKFTIKDLAEGKCAVKNDGTIEELNKVLKAAFPECNRTGGEKLYYMTWDKCICWGYNIINIPFQSVKDFLEELESLKLPKRGDRILVKNRECDKWYDKIFVTFIPGSVYSICCVLGNDEEKFYNNKPFMTNEWEYWKPIEKKVLEVTLEDIAKKYEVDEVKIVEKKG